MLFNKIILIIFIICIYIDCKNNTNNNKKIQNNQEDESSIIKSFFDWAKQNNIYINKKLSLNRKAKMGNYFSFCADSRIKSGTLLFRVPYDMMITQHSLNEMYKNSKNKKFAKLWEEITKLESEYIKYISTKQFFYISLMLENANRRMKGPVYKKFKEFFKLHNYMNMDIYPVFYDEDEKRYLSGSSFGSDLTRADSALNEEYFIATNNLSLSIPFQEEFSKFRVISLVSCATLNNTNFEEAKDINQTILVPFLDCFTKEIFEDRANARYETRGEKNDTTNLTDFFFEIYATQDIVIGGEVNLFWNSFPNSELLLYYGFVEEGNQKFSNYYIDVLNPKFKEDLKINNDSRFEEKNVIYELVHEIDSPSVIDIYKNLSQYLDKYKNKKEGAYQMMKDNLKDYYDIYEYYYTDGNIINHLNGKDKIMNIKEIIHLEKKLISEKMKYLENKIQDIKKGKSETKNNEDESLSSKEEL